MSEGAIQQGVWQQPTEFLQNEICQLCISAAAVKMSVVIIANFCYSFTSDLPQTGCICTFFIWVLLCALNSSPLLNLTTCCQSRWYLPYCRGCTVTSHLFMWQFCDIQVETKIQINSGFLNICYLIAHSGQAQDWVQCLVVEVKIY